MQDIFLKNLNYLIKKTNLSRQFIADSLGIEISSLTKYLNGTRNLDYEKRAKIAEILQTPLNHLESIDFEITDPKLPFSSYAKLNLNESELSSDSQIQRILEEEFVFLDNIKDKDDDYLTKLAEVKKVLSNKKTDLNLIKTVDYFISYSKETEDPVTLVNSLTLILLGWVIVKSPLINPEEAYLKARIESVYDNSHEKDLNMLKYKESYYFECMDLLQKLNQFNEYKDFIPYFLALKCMVNFNYGGPEQSDNEAMAVGANLLSELILIGNKFAKNLTKIK